MRYFATDPKGSIDKLEIFVEPADLGRLCAQYAPTNLYRISENTKENHEWGNGGFREITTELLKGDQPLILSIHYDSWDTTSDDSIDYDMLKVRRTYLLQDDSVAKQIFDALRIQVQ